MRSLAEPVGIQVPSPHDAIDQEHPDIDQTWESGAAVFTAAIEQVP